MRPGSGRMAGRHLCVALRCGVGACRSATPRGDRSMPAAIGRRLLSGNGFAIAVAWRHRRRRACPHGQARIRGSAQSCAAHPEMHGEGASWSRQPVRTLDGVHARALCHVRQRTIDDAREAQLPHRAGHDRDADAGADRPVIEKSHPGLGGTASRRVPEPSGGNLHAPANEHLARSPALARLTGRSGNSLRGEGHHGATLSGRDAILASRPDASLLQHEPEEAHHWAVRTTQQNLNHLPSWRALASVAVPRSQTFTGRAAAMACEDRVFDDVAAHRRASSVPGHTNVQKKFLVIATQSGIVRSSAWFGSACSPCS